MKGAIVDLIHSKAQALAGICRRFRVSRLEVFGSACTSEFDPDRSDLDFLVEFDPDCNLGPWMARFFELQAALCDLFGRPVDLIMPSALRDPWFRREANKTRRVVYDASQVRQMAQ